MGEGSAKTYQRLSEIVAGEEELATVRVVDFLFPAVVSERYGIANALEAAGPGELQLPIVQLHPSDLCEPVRHLVIDYMKDKAAQDLGLTRAEAAFVGLDGLVTRRKLLEPPKWHLWNSAAARQVRMEAGWLKEMLEKVKRHVLRPVEQAYSDISSQHDLAKLGLELQQLGRSLKEGDLPVHRGMNELASYLCQERVVSEEVFDQPAPAAIACQAVVLREPGCAAHIAASVFD